MLNNGVLLTTLTLTRPTHSNIVYAMILCVKGGALRRFSYFLWLAVSDSPSTGGICLRPVVVLVEARHYAEVRAALRTVVLGLPPQDPAALVHRVPAEVAAQWRT